MPHAERTVDQLSSEAGESDAGERPHVCSQERGLVLSSDLNHERGRRCHARANNRQEDREGEERRDDGGGKGAQRGRLEG